MGERRTELNRRQHRRKKMLRLKARLAHAKDAREREQILQKIKAFNPTWVEPAATP